MLLLLLQCWQCRIGTTTVVHLYAFQSYYSNTAMKGSGKLLLKSKLLLILTPHHAHQRASGRCTPPQPGAHIFSPPQFSCSAAPSHAGSQSCLILFKLTVYALVNTHKPPLARPLRLHRAVADS
jgi:hypothetical protein